MTKIERIGPPSPRDDGDEDDIRRRFGEAQERYWKSAAAWKRRYPGDFPAAVTHEYCAAKDAFMLAEAPYEDAVLAKLAVLEADLPEALDGGGLRGFREIVWVAAIKADLLTLGIGRDRQS